MIGMNTNTLGTGLNDLLGFFGFRGGQLGAVVDSLTGNDLGVLMNLQDAAWEAASRHGTGFMQRHMNMVAFGHMMAPGTMMPMMAPYAGAGYFGGTQHIDLAAGSMDIPFFSRLFSGRRAMAGNYERLLRTRPDVRAAFEAQVGGKIVNFGLRNNGKMTIQRFGPGFGGMGAAINPMMAPMMGYMGSMGSFANAYAMGMGMPGGMGAMGGMLGNPFMAMTTMGLYNAAGIRSPSNTAGGVYGFYDNSGIWGGQSFGSTNPQVQPGRINNTNPMYEVFHQNEADLLMADPSLTVEDKVTLLLMLIMKKMDRDIENQAQYINSIQQQQSSRGGKGKAGNPLNTGPFGQLSGSNNQSPSIDVETMKLKRMIDKRSQMFDMLRQIIDKYNETAKNMIQSIGR